MLGLHFFGTKFLSFITLTTCHCIVFFAALGSVLLIVPRTSWRNRPIPTLGISHNLLTIFDSPFALVSVPALEIAKALYAPMSVSIGSSPITDPLFVACRISPLSAFTVPFQSKSAPLFTGKGKTIWGELNGFSFFPIANWYRPVLSRRQ